MADEEIVLFRISYRQSGLNDGWPEILEGTTGRYITDHPFQIGIPLSRAISGLYKGSDRSAKYEVVLRKIEPRQKKRKRETLDVIGKTTDKQAGRVNFPTHHGD